MKPIAITSFIVLSSLGIGMFQQARLTGLAHESFQLSRKIPSEGLRRHLSSGLLDSPADAEISSDELLAQIESQMAELIEKAHSHSAGVNKGQPVDPSESSEYAEALHHLYESFSLLDADGILKLIQRLKSDPKLPESLGKQPEQACVEILMEVNPKVLMAVMPHLKDYPKSNEVMSNALYRWLLINPSAATKWYDEESAKGNPLTRTMLYDIILEESKLDPSQALSRALANEAADCPQDIKNLGANIATKLDEVDENLIFFSALRRESEKSPGSPLLADIRRTYVGELGRRLYQWPFESVQTLINADFTSAEKTVMAKEISSHGDLDDPDKWATWMAKIPMPADGRHPLEDFFGFWFHFAPAIAGEWLKQVPPGELKDKLVKEMAGN